MLFSQDLIVKPDGDSINCRINKISKSMIYFSYRDGWNLHDTALPLAEIKSFKEDFYERSEVPYDWNRGIEDFKAFQVYVNGGAGFEVARLPEFVPDDLRSYYQDLRSGYYISAGFSYFPDETFGVGMKVSRFMTSNRIDNYTFKNSDGSHSNGILSDRLSISFIGPSISTTKVYLNGNSVFTSVYAGYINYIDDQVAITRSKLNGETFGIGIEGGFEVSVNDNLMLSFQASLFNGSLRKYQVTQGKITKTVYLEKGEYESLLRIDLAAGIIIRL